VNGNNNNNNNNNKSAAGVLAVEVSNVTSLRDVTVSTPTRGNDDDVMTTVRVCSVIDVLAASASTTER